MNTLALNSCTQHPRWNEEEFLREGFFLQWDSQWDLMAWGPSHRCSQPLAHQISCYIPDFYMEDGKPWCIFKQGGLFHRNTRLELSESLSRSQTKEPWTQRIWKEPSFEEFSQIFLRIQNQIHSNTLKKAVPIVFAQSDGEISHREKRQSLWPSPPPPHTTGHLTDHLEEWPQLYGWWNEGEGILGLTPELLLSYHPEKKSINTMALAGTKRTGEASLLLDPKECMEHQLVVEGIQQALHPIGPVQIGPTYEWNNHSIQHLRTDIEVKITVDDPDDPLDFHKLCELAHPTPALGLSSSCLHWKWLKEIDPPTIPRKRFGAPFGAQLPDGRAKALVAIRNIQWFGEKSYIGSGCGIVKLSQLEREWRELALKRQSVSKNLWSPDKW